MLVCLGADSNDWEVQLTTLARYHNKIQSSENLCGCFDNLPTRIVARVRSKHRFRESTNELQSVFHSLSVNEESKVNIFAHKTRSCLLLEDFIATRFFWILFTFDYIPCDSDGFTVKLVAIYTNWVELNSSCSCRAWLASQNELTRMENRDKLAVMNIARPCSKLGPWVM